MTQEYLNDRVREQRASEELAAELDALSRPLAERVLGRAIELDQEAKAAAEAAADTIGYEELKDIALEVGISEDSLKEALLEEFNTEKDPGASPVDRATVPKHVHGGVIVAGLAEDVINRLTDHLERAEGLRQQRRRGHSIQWAPPPPKRAWPAETWTVTQDRNDRQLVEIDLDMAGPRKTFWRWVIGLFVLSILFGSPLGGLVFLGIFVAGVVAAVGWLKRVAKRARRTINRAFASLTDDGDESGIDDWLDVWERLHDRR